MWKDRLSEISERRRLALGVWVGIAVLMSALHLFLHAGAIHYGDLPLDDAGTWGVARRPLGVVLTLPTEFHSQPPLYYLLLHFVLKISGAAWFLRGFSWLWVLALLQLILFFADELGLLTRVFLSLLVVYSDITHYLATAVRPYGMAAFWTLGSSLMLLRLLREPTRRRAVAYGLWTFAMLYTMAFEVSVLMAHGWFALGVCLWDLRKLGWPGLLSRYRYLVLALGGVVLAYVPYLVMAIHYQYKANPTKTLERALSVATYDNVLTNLFHLPLPVMMGLGMLCGLALVAGVRDRDRTVLLWPLVAFSSIAFVVYFIVGRSPIGAQPKYMLPAFIAVSYLAALGFGQLIRTPRRAAWVVLPFLLAWLIQPAYVAFAATVKAPPPTQQFGLLAREMAKHPGKKIIFFDIGYDGQHLEYAARDDADIGFATMAGSGWAAGGENHLDPGYIVKTIEDNRAATRCFFYFLQYPKGPYATTFVPAMARLGYKEVPALPRIAGRSVPGFCH